MIGRGASGLAAGVLPRRAGSIYKRPYALPTPTPQEVPQKHDFPASLEISKGQVLGHAALPLQGGPQDHWRQAGSKSAVLR